MKKFLPQKDDLSRLINEQAADLLHRLKNLPVEELGLPHHVLEYFKSSHYKRLYFSIETSAHLLYRSITLKNKRVQDIVIMDYGAGVGTLYMLAKMIGCKQVVYNDHLDDWKTSAQLIATAIGIQVDEYVVGDVEHTLQHLRQKQVDCDIITSRNVVEHIYKLDLFFRHIGEYQPQAIIYSSTTANYYNPASNIKHILWHRKWEKIFVNQRIDIIRRNKQDLSEKEIIILGKATRGLAMEELNESIENYRLTKILPDPWKHHTNTCDPTNGVWFEHLLTFKEYRSFIDPAQYTIRFEPGFWDTHNTSSWKNIIGKILNPIIRLVGTAGILFAPFIYVIVVPRKISS